MNETFKKEWELYQRGLVRPVFRGTKPKPSSAKFDTPVRIGEVRIFADTNRPFVALVVSDKGAFGYDLVPCSPFTVPASAREMLVGERVYQLWNTCPAAKRFVERSWLVETLAAEDLADITAALAEVPVGAVSTDPTAAAYEWTFRVAGGNFRFLQDEPAVVRVAWWRRGTAWGLAAMLMVCCGLVGVLYQERVFPNRREAAVMGAKAERRLKAFGFGEDGPLPQTDAAFREEAAPAACEKPKAAPAPCAAPPEPTLRQDEASAMRSALVGHTMTILYEIIPFVSRGRGGVPPPPAANAGRGGVPPPPAALHRRPHPRGFENASRNKK